VSLPWDEPGWLDRATSWIDRQVERTGEVELERTRPWAVVARVPTAAGLLWFKESPPAHAFEPALTALLARRRPDAVPDVVAAEGARLLTRDVGPRLRDVLDAGATEPRWEDTLALWAEEQIEFAALVDEALAVGTPGSTTRSSAQPRRWTTASRRRWRTRRRTRATCSSATGVPC
jgi:hypothetical protein